MATTQPISTPSGGFATSKGYELEFPQSIILGEILFDQRKVVAFDKNTTVLDAARILKKENFLSAPVFDLEMKYFVGVLDVHDIARWVALGYSLEKAYKDHDFESWSFAQGTVMDILEQSPKSRRIFIMESNQSLESAMKILSFRDHRMLVSNSNSKEGGRVLVPQLSEEGTLRYTEVETQKQYALLTQSDVVRYIANNRSKLPGSLMELFHKPLRDLGLVDMSAHGEATLTISKEELVIDALLKMFDEGVTALAVVEKPRGELVHNLSGSDLRGLSPEMMKLLLQKRISVEAFLKEVRHQSNRPKHAISVTANNNLNDVIDKIVASKIHRVWVVDKDSKPIGIVSLTDIITVALGIFSDKKTA